MPGVHQLIAEVDGEVAGFIELVTYPDEPRHRHVGEINLVATHERFSGQGIGRALMTSVIELADDWLNIVRLGLTVFVDNPRAIELYERLGFEIEGTLRGYGFKRGELVDAHVMSRLRPRLALTNVDAIAPACTAAILGGWQHRPTSCASTARRRWNGSTSRRRRGSSSCTGSCANPRRRSPNCTTRFPGSRPRSCDTTTTCPSAGSAPESGATATRCCDRPSSTCGRASASRSPDVAALLYRDGQDFQGLHSDREMRWLDETLIAIVVLGARRPFVLRPRLGGVPVERVPAGSDPDDLILTPGEGDMLVMGGACQREWMHGVPAAPVVDRSRISLTWRWTSRRGRPDTNPTFYDGRHFSDGARQPGSRARPT